MIHQVQQARRRIESHAIRTPVMTSTTLDHQVGAQVFLKCENFQRVGAFKFRGAYNAISQLSAAEKSKGVITYSSGNHAQAVALACQLLDIQSTVVMPNNAPQIKRAATQAYRARIVEYDPHTADRAIIAKQLAKEHGYSVVPPFDHMNIVLGQGTCALEMIEQVGQLDHLLVPTGGGGLLSGCAIVAKAGLGACRVMGIEPETADDATRSFYSKTLQRVHNPATIADGTRTASLGEVTFPLVLQHVDAMQTVSELAIIHAVQFLFYRMKLVVEPSGALGLAWLLHNRHSLTGRIGVIISGGNIDAQMMSTILQHPTQAPISDWG